MALSEHELALLLVLIRNRGRVVRRDELYRTVWASPLPRGSRSVDAYIFKLRAKIGQVLPGWLVIHTHVGWGYRLEPERRDWPDGHDCLDEVPEQSTHSLALAISETEEVAAGSAVDASLDRQQATRRAIDASITWTQERATNEGPF